MNVDKGTIYVYIGFITSIFGMATVMTILAKYGALIAIVGSVVVMIIGFVIYAHGSSMPARTCDDKVRSS